MSAWKVSLLLFTILSLASAWHTCKDEPFCRKLRNRSRTTHSLDREMVSIDVTTGKVYALLRDHTNHKEYNLVLSVYEHDVIGIRFQNRPVNEKPIPSALREDLRTTRLFSGQQFKNDIKLWLKHHNVTIGIEDFRISVKNVRTHEEILVNEPRDLHLADSLAVKVTFKRAQSAYGIPAHGERLKLKDTKRGEPYRHFNVDYGSYRVESPESLYGSVPVLYAHGSRAGGRSHVAGAFWHNPAQTFVDVDHGGGDLTVDFIAEAGVADLFVLPGGDFKRAVDDYVFLTGAANLPPLFALGYHQSRYSYATQADVMRVANGLRDGDFPADVIWLDIDHADGKRYFTWNYSAFPDPVGMQYELEERSMRLVTIVDPHIKAEDGYFVYDEMKAKGYHVKNPDGSMYVGECWPGKSAYVDFFNPDALEWWSGLYDYDSYSNTTSIVSVWNDMNEPSVFGGEEKTMARDNLHHGRVRHKEVHNMYGHMQAKGTYDGLVARDYVRQRPFVLTRSHFAGTQRYAAIWTGDNVATWEHLRVSVSICLSEALAGLSFCGTDVGGFSGRPTDELFQRWYQLGAWYPFFRAHSSKAQDYRDPFLYPKDVQRRIRNAIRQRYAHLPYWYTAWYEHEASGAPVLRPLVYSYPDDAKVLSIDAQFLIGANVLIAPVLHEGARNSSVYLPPEDAWYYFPSKDKASFEVLAGKRELRVGMDSVPVFYRAGSIVPKKDNVRGSTALMKDEPHDLYIYAKHKAARGTLYEDDAISFDYRKGVFNYLTLAMTESESGGFEVACEPVSSASYDGKFTLGSVYIFYERDAPQDTRVTLEADGENSAHSITRHGNFLAITFNVLIKDRRFVFYSHR